MRKSAILLDKSYLQGSKASEIQQLGDSHQLLMADVLFFELISSQEPGRSRCFAKLPNIENPVVLVKHVGALLKQEIGTHQPCGKPSNHFEDIRYRFNKDLRAAEYKLSSSASEAMQEINEELHTDVASFLERVRLIPRLIPNLLEGSDEERRICREDAEVFIATEKDEMRNFYAGFPSPPGGPPLPPAQILNEDWALFRWQQVQLLLAMDAYCRYGGRVPDLLSGRAYEKAEHDVLDAQYLVLGTLEGAFATREKKLQRWFSLLCPDGHLFS